MQKLKSSIPVQFLCKYFLISKSYFYSWLKGVETPRKRLKNEICKAISKSFYESKKTYGSPRVYDDLKDWGFKVSEKL